MARPERTDHRARYCLLSDDHSPCGVWGITSWSLVASGGENFDKRCRDFRRRQNRGISEILGGRRLKSPDRFPLNALLRRFIRIRGAYKPCRRSCGRFILTQFRRFPVLTEERTTFRANECSIESPCTATNGRRTPYFREAGNKIYWSRNPLY